MKTKLFFFLLVSFVVFGAKAQESQEIVDYYNLKIDELVGKWQDISSDYDEEKTNPVYAKVFTSPVLYKSVIEKAFSTETDNETTEPLSIDDQRSEVIDALMLDLYKEAPGHVKMTEDELRKEKSVLEYNPRITGLNLKINRGIVPNDVVGGLKTTVVKPNYWKFSGRSSLTFTQSFISENWYQGGEKNYYSMLAAIDLDLNYDNKERLTWANHFDFDLGFATYELDEKLAIRTNTDKLRLESTFGYKLVKSLDLAVKLKAESQSLPYYNTDVLVSACLSPLDANASIGLNYKPNLGNFQLHVFVAPLSAYNFRYVYHNDLRAAYGLEEGAAFKHDYGTQVVVTIPTYKITSFLDVYSRLEYYTDYQRAFFQWETKFNVALSKYFTASLMMNARFDDSVEIPHEKWNFWQLKELFTLGVSYAW
ncbi:MAG: DUF3078 domain-containing protein [Bacteroidaceae bacterium]|nr:DUF3078 domain-containing protein [Bacteroidaceae bacterium]